MPLGLYHSLSNYMAPAAPYFRHVFHKICTSTICVSAAVILTVPCAANKTRRVLKKRSQISIRKSMKINILCKEIKCLKYDVSQCFLFALSLLCEHITEFGCCACAHAYLALGERINPLGPLQETRKKSE